MAKCNFSDCKCNVWKTVLSNFCSSYKKHVQLKFSLSFTDIWIIFKSSNSKQSFWRYKNHMIFPEPYQKPFLTQLYSRHLFALSLALVVWRILKSLHEIDKKQVQNYWKKIRRLKKVPFATINSSVI